MAANRIETAAERLFGKEFSSLHADLLSGLPAIDELARDLAAGRLTSLRAGVLPSPLRTGSFTAASGAGASGVSSGYGGTSSPGGTPSAANAGFPTAATLPPGTARSASSTGGAPVVATMDGFPNWPPVAGDDYYDLPHDTTLEEYPPGVMWNDIDMEPLVASLLSYPSHYQSFQFSSNGSFTYTPTPGWADNDNPDSFTYEVSDGEYTDAATVYLQVLNYPPLAANDGPYYTDAATSLVVDAPGVLENDSDFEGDPRTAVPDTGPSHGTLNYLNLDGSFKYTPDGTYVGTDTFTYYANDGFDNSLTPATVSIEISPSVDLDIEGIGDTPPQEQEVVLGGLVVRRADGNDAPRKKITIQTPKPAGWTDEVKLARNNAKVSVFTDPFAGTEMPFNEFEELVIPVSMLPLDLYVQGAEGSNLMRDAQLTAHAQGALGVASDVVSFTVVWVNTIGIRSGPQLQVSGDNSAREVYRAASIAHTYDLGIQDFNIPADGAPRRGHGIETWAQVQPPDFDYPGANLKLSRDAEFAVHSGLAGDQLIQSKSFSPIIPYGNDLSLPEWRDDTPLDSDPPGSIYDLDAPGLLLTIEAVGEVRRIRANFRAFAQVDVAWATPVRASWVLPFYVRMSITQSDAPSGSNWLEINDVTGDNTVGSPTTSLNWDLQ